MIRVSRLAMIALIASAPFAFSQPQELGPTNVYDLSRALRDYGHADLALEYLDSLTAKLPKEQQQDLKLERAKARLDQASQEAVDAKRDDLINVAKNEFEDFLKTSPNHPRAVEANISLARVATMLGKQQLGRATKAEAEKPEDTSKLRKEQAALARPFFENSAKQYAAAAKKLEDQANAALATATKRDLITSLYQALLDQAINQYNLGESYLKPVGKEVVERSNAFKEARTLFSKLADRDPKHPLCWVAKAWEGECNRPMQELGKADRVDDEIKSAYLKDPTGAPAAGYRMSRFFTIIDKRDLANEKPSPAAFQALRKLCEDWLKDYRSAKLTREHYAINFYIAGAYFDEARTGMKYDEKTKVTTIPESARLLLLRAEREFRVLTQTSNDYDARSVKERYTIIRLLVGDGAKSLAGISSFDECHMTMIVALEKMNAFLKEPPPGEGADEKLVKDYKKKKDELFARVISLLNREKDFPVPKESAREAAMSQITQIFLYRQAGRTYEAAVMAEALARSSRSPATIAKAGQNAFLAYREAAFLTDPSDEESKTVDQARALKVAEFLEKTVPEEPATEEIRLMQAKLLVQAKRYVEAFDVLCRITLGSNSLVEARLMQGGIAYDLLRYKSPTEAPAARKDGIRARAIADLARVPVPSKPGDALRFVRLKLQLAQLYLTGPASGYATAEKVVVETIALIPKLPGLKEDEKLSMQMVAEMVHIDTVYGQAMPLFNAGKYEECAAKFMEMLLAIAKAGPALKDDTPGDLKTTAGRLDAMRLERLIMPSLSARARQGKIDSCTELLDLAKLFGGDLSKSVAAVYQVIDQARFQVEKLKAENKPDESKALLAKVTAMLNKLLEEKNMTVGMKYNLAKACKELGDYPKAIELIKQIPKPKVLDPKPPEAELETDSEDVRIAKDTAKKAHAEEMKVVNLYKAGVLELARVYRAGKMFAEGDALYDEVLGKADPDKTKHRKTGWASKAIDFRKEFFAYGEVKAANTTDDKAASALWVEAIGNWAGLTGEYANVVNNLNKQLNAAPAAGAAPLNPKQIAALEEQIKKFKGIYYEMQFETYRCTLAANVSLYTKKPDTLAKAMTKQGTNIATTELKNPEIPNEVRVHYRALLLEYKALEAPYKAAGGLGFPDLPPEAPKPATTASADAK